MGFAGVSVSKESCSVQETQETQVRSLGWEDPLEEKTATHSSILAWKSQGQRSLVGYSPWDHKRVGHDLATEHAVRLHAVRLCPAL